MSKQWKSSGELSGG